MFVKAINSGDIFEGGIAGVELNGESIAFCKYSGKIYAVSRKCGHLNAKLDKGTLNGYILTCPLHFAQFDITTGEALIGPVPIERIKNSISMVNDKMKDLKTYKVKIEKNEIFVDI